MLLKSSVTKIIFISVLFFIFSKLRAQMMPSISQQVCCDCGGMSVSCAAISSDGNFIFLGFTDGKISCVSTGTLSQELLEIQVKNPIYEIKISSNGCYILANSSRSNQNEIVNDVYDSVNASLISIERIEARFEINAYFQPEIIEYCSVNDFGKIAWSDEKGIHLLNHSGLFAEIVEPLDIDCGKKNGFLCFASDNNLAYKCCLGGNNGISINCQRVSERELFAQPHCIDCINLYSMIVCSKTVAAIVYREVNDWKIHYLLRYGLFDGANIQSVKSHPIYDFIWATIKDDGKSKIILWTKQGEYVATYQVPENCTVYDSNVVLFDGNHELMLAVKEDTTNTPYFLLISIPVRIKNPFRYIQNRQLTGKRPEIVKGNYMITARFEEALHKHVFGIETLV